MVGPKPRKSGSEIVQRLRRPLVKVVHPNSSAALLSVGAGSAHGLLTLGLHTHSLASLETSTQTGV